eukprot:190973-Pleurochrysis_carterae.AAC.1
MRAPTGLEEPRVFSCGYMLVNVPHAFKNNVRLSLMAHECVGLSTQACASCTHARVHRAARVHTLSVRDKLRKLRSLSSLSNEFILNNEFT